MGKFGTMALQLITTMILARFLSPEDFGTVAMCSIFLSISEMLIDSGMAGSLIFHKDVEEIELHSLFWTNLFISVVIYFILFLSSASIANFYHVPVLASIVKVIGISTIIHSFCLIQSALLSKKMDFKLQTKILILSAVFSSISVIFLAYYQAGVWTLVAQPILLKVFQAFFYTVYGSYRPKLQYSLRSLKRHWIFGSHLLASSFLKLIYDNMYIQVIGRIVNLKEAGFYSQAKRFNDIPTNLIAFPLERVIFPALVNSKNMIQSMKKMSIFFNIIIIPLLTLGALLSDDIILVLLGEKWKSSGWILSFMFFGTIGASLEALNRNFIKASGKTKILLKFDLIKRVFNVAILAIGVNWGLQGILFAFIINGAISWFINCYALKIAINYNLGQQILDVFTISLISIVPYFICNYLFANYDINIAFLIAYKTILYSFILISLLVLLRRKQMFLILSKLKKNA